MSITDSQPRGQTQQAGAGPRRYLRVFKHLHGDQPAIVKHGMHTQPLVDVYELGAFDAAVSADETVEPAPVRFYLYHGEDATVRIGGGTTLTVDPPGDPSYRIPFRDALREADIRVHDQAHIGDVIGEFWEKLFSPPSDRLGEEHYANSRWLDRNVGDRRTIRELRDGGAWDELRLMYRPRKTLNFPRPGGIDARFIEVFELIPKGEQRRAADLAKELILGEQGAGTGGAPPCVEVTHLGVDTVGLRLLEGGPRELVVMALLRS